MKDLNLIFKVFSYNGTMVCLSLTAPTLAQMTSDIDAYHSYIDLLELRADLLSAASVLEDKDGDVRYFADACIAWIHGEKKRHALPCIFTLRSESDGGLCKAACEQKRREVLQYIVASQAFDYVDVEAEYPSFCQQMYEQTKNSDTMKLIVSKHYFDYRCAFYENNDARHSDDFIDCARMPWLREMKMLICTYPHAIVKHALTCTTSSQLCALFEAAKDLHHMQDQYVLAAMGDFGRPARILSARIGSLWTYASLQGTKQAAMGHFDPKELCEIYSYKKITKETRVFAVVGNPVMHSKSPTFHNARFKEKKLNAVYIHLPLDNVKILPTLIKNMNVYGLSVTIPHKTSVLSQLDETDALVQGTRSCNTIVVHDTLVEKFLRKKTHGYNTDIQGFLTPLTTRLVRLHMRLCDMKCTVLGSGGTAQSISHALLREGACVLIVNRTLEKAKELARFLSTCYDTEVLHSSITDYRAIAAHDSLIVQTTSVGMNAASKTPLANYRFSGKEIAYDIVYTPSRTKFLQDAEASGCLTISGKEMFISQAEAQSEFFCKAAHPY